MLALPAKSTCSTCLRQLRKSVPDFLVPGLATNTIRTFSTSHSLSKRGMKDKRTPNRGVSPLRRTGPRQRLSVHGQPLPKPVTDAKRRSKVEVDPNHGLWGFFNENKDALSKPEEDNAYGRAWTAEELRRKSWEDLHGLWWVCAKERNRIATSNNERERLEAGLGKEEAGERDETVRQTQQAIKHVLTERWYAWEHANKLAANDPSVVQPSADEERRYNPYEDEEGEYSEGVKVDEHTKAPPVEPHKPETAYKQIRKARIPEERVGVATEERAVS